MLNLLETAADLANPEGPRPPSRRRHHAGGDRQHLRALRQGRGEFLRSDLGAAQVGARQRSRRVALLAVPHARGRLRSDVHRAACRAHGERGHRQCRSARAHLELGGLRGVRAAGEPRRRARDRAGDRFHGVRGEEQCRLHRVRRGDGGCLEARLARGAAAPAQCAHPSHERDRLWEGLPLRAR